MRRKCRITTHMAASPTVAGSAVSFVCLCVSLCLPVVFPVCRSVWRSVCRSFCRSACHQAGCKLFYGVNFDGFTRTLDRPYCEIQAFIRVAKLCSSDQERARCDHTRSVCLPWHGRQRRHHASACAHLSGWWAAKQLVTSCGRRDQACLAPRTDVDVCSVMLLCSSTHPRRLAASLETVAPRVPQVAEWASTTSSITLMMQSWLALVERACVPR